MKPRTPDEILKSATRLFAKAGKDGVTMSQIADLAGVNKAALFYYFRNKDHLYRIVLKSSLLHFLGTFESEVLKQAHQKQAQLPTIITEIFFEYFRRHPEFIQLLLWELAANGKVILELLQQFSQSKKFSHLYNTIAILWNISSQNQDDQTGKLEFVRFLGTIFAYPLLHPLMEFIFDLDEHRREKLLDAYVKQINQPGA
ncbi:MAG: hypothetical protein Kow0042_01440 [Calditrichia bacterium]